MKKDFDEAKLVDAVLADESWESCNARLHGDALAALRAGKKSRARWMAAAQIMALPALLGAIWWSFNGARDVPGSQQLRRDTAFANLSHADLHSECCEPGTSRAPRIMCRTSPRSKCSRCFPKEVVCSRKSMGRSSSWFLTRPLPDAVLKPNEVWRAASADRKREPNFFTPSRGLLPLAKEKRLC